MAATSSSSLKLVRRGAGLLVLAVAVVYLTRVVSGPDLASAGRALLRDPLGVLTALGMYGCAFALRAWSWCRVLPGLSLAHSWSALHVSLLGNHVLPFRLGEALRVTTVLRRTRLSPAPVVASTVTLRSADLAAVALLALVAAPALLTALAGPWLQPLIAVLILATLAGALWLTRLNATPPPPSPSGARADGLGGAGRRPCSPSSSPRPSWRGCWRRRSCTRWRSWPGWR
nr:hypothetical protein GCM10020093_057110 [Planobispora longispora]